ncbi:hypothetical protein Chor_013678 [Crotalus horridus]
MPSSGLSREALLAATAAAGAALAVGFLAGRRYHGSDLFAFGISSSFSGFLRGNDNLHKYVVDHSVREHPLLKKLRLAASGPPGKKLWVSRDQAQLVANLIRLLGAKKVIEIEELLANGEAGTFDLAFIHADKEHYNDYYEKCLRLIKKGKLLVLDNVLVSGKVLKLGNSDRAAQHIHQLNEKIFHDPRVNISMILIGNGITLGFKL